MDVMYIRHKIGGISPLLVGEKLLYSQQRFQAVSVSCAINRGFWKWGIKLCVTNRRLFLSCCVLPFYRQEVDLWFPGQQPEGKTESVTDVSIEKEGLRRPFWSLLPCRFGPFLEVRSRDPSRRQSWFSAPDLTMRLFCKEPESIERAIREVMTANQCP